jgi:hypothetical protein
LITEPDVTFTDYAVALECAVFAGLILKSGLRSCLGAWFVFFFGSLSLGALLGGTVHGFFLDESTVGYKILWPATLIALGLTALAAWGIAARMLFSTRTARRISLGATLLFLLYCGVILFVKQDFFIAILHYLPPAIFLLMAWFILYRRTQSKRVCIGVLGLGLTFVTAGVQQAQVMLHPVYFNHNAFCHLIQAIALFMIFMSARWLTSEYRSEMHAHANS